VGTGPYKFEEWVGSDHVSGVRWEKYWRKGVDGKALPYTDKATMRFIKNTSVKIMELKAGNAHIIDNVQVKDFKAVEGGDNVQLVNSPLSIAQYMAMNVTRPPFDNKDLRKAINYAVNHKAIEKVISRGYGQVTPLFMGEGGLDYFSAKEVPAYQFNPAKAKEYYKKSGHKGAITLVVIQRDPDTQIAQLLQSQLKQVGINLKISVLERKAWVAKVLKLDYECGILRMTGPSPDPDILWAKFFGPNARFNWVGMKDKKVFEAVVNAATTLDRDERRKWYKQATVGMLDQAYYAFLFRRPTKHASSKKLMNLKKEYMGSWMLSDCWIAK
jgi:peptide/nickel transport system substrate-binding protein